MAGTDGKVKIGVEVYSNDAKKQLGDLEKESSGILSKIGDAAKAATIAIGGAATAVAGYALKVGTSFESTMSEVQAISGATGDQMQQLTDKAKEMGSTTSFSATEAGEAFTYMAMAGWKTGDMLSGIEGIMNLAAASGENLATTSDIVTDALTAFGMSASESGKFANILAAASSNANTNVSMLGESFKYVAPVAGALGYSAEDTSVALGLMANAGIKAGQAGTSLRAALNALVKPGSDVAAALIDEYGIGLTTAEGKTKSLKEVMDDLRSGMGDLSEAEQAEAAARIFGSEAMSGMLAIINASEQDYNKLTDAIYASAEATATTAEDMANIRLDNLSGQLTLLQSAAEGFGLVVYESMAAPLTDLVKSGQQAISMLTTELETNGVASMLYVGSVLLANMLNGIASQMPQITTKAGEVISGFIESTSRNFPRIIDSGVSVLTSFISGIGSQLPQLIPQALSMVVTLADAVIRNIPKIVQAGIDLLTGLVQGIINSLPTLITEGPRIVNQFADAIYSGIGKMLSTGLKLIIELGKGIINNMPLIIQNGGQILMALINAFSLSKMLSLGKSLITNLGSGIKSMASNLASGAKSVASNAMNAIRNLDWKSIGSHVIKSIVNGIKALASMLKSTLVTTAKNAFTAVKNIDVKSIGTNIIKGIINGVKSMASSLASAALGVVKSAVNGVKDFLGIHSPSRLMEDLIGHNMMAGIEVAIEGDTSDLEKAAVDSIKSITDAMSDVDYVAKLKTLHIPDISALLGIRTPGQDGDTENSGIGGTIVIDPDKIKKAMKEGISEAMKDVKVDIDGRTAGKLLAPHINEFLPQPAY